MRVLVLWATEASPNLGVRVLAEGTAALVHRVWPSADITFHNYGEREPHLPIGRLRSLMWERVLGRRGMQDWLRGFDLIVDTRSGDSFSDIYGLHRHAVMTAVAEFAVQAGVPVVLGPQTIGPFRTLTGRALARRTLSRVSLVLARDERSALLAEKLVRTRVVRTTDVVFALPVPAPSARRDVILNVSGLLWNENPHVDSELYRATLARTHDTLVASGRTVSILAHVVESGNADSDAHAAHEFAARAGDAEVVIPRGLGDVRATLAGATSIIGSRMHACLNALSVGTPAVPLAYSDKFAPLLDGVGWEHTVDLRDGGDVASRVLAELRAAEAHDTAGVRERAAAALSAAEFALVRSSPVAQ